jgi:predicted DNA-binding transcriptional regulator YafY
VRFAPGAASSYVRERRWSRDQEMERDETGNLFLDFTSSNREELISWVLGFGSQAELLLPEDLRGEMGRVAAAMAEAYGAKP